jgi:hypothetical protein
MGVFEFKAFPGSFETFDNFYVEHTVTALSIAGETRRSLWDRSNRNYCRQLDRDCLQVQRVL